MEIQLETETNRVNRTVTPEKLVDGYIRKECHLLGDIHNVPIALDIGNRSHILEIVDNARVKMQCTGTRH
jgi:hypothetical protein